VTEPKENECSLIKATTPFDFTILAMQKTIASFEFNLKQPDP